MEKYSSVLQYQILNSNEKDKGVSPMVSKGVDHQYQRRVREVSPDYCPVDANIRFSIGRQAE